MTPQLRFPDFTDEWQVKKLGDIFDVRDGTHESPAYFDSGKPLLTSKNLSSNGTLNFDNISYISQNDFESINRRSAVDVGDILFGMIGTIGNPVKVDTNDFAIKNVALLKPKSVGSDYLIQYLRSQIIEKQFYQKNTGGTQKFIALGDIRTLKVSTPTKPEQEKIADFLTAVDERIAASEHKYELLARYKRGVMQQLFSQKIRFKKLDGSNYPDWQEKTLSEISKRVTRRNKNNEVSYVLTNSATAGVVSQTGYFDKSIANSNNLTNYYIVEKGDFVYNPRISSHAPVGPIKRNNLSTGVMSPLYSVFNITEGDGIFYEQYFRTNYWHDYMRSIANYGARHDRMNISTTDLYEMPMPFPTQEEQQKIADFLTALDSRIATERTKLTAAKQFKKALLQRMFV